MASWPPAHLTPVDPAAILNGDGEFAALFAEAFGTIGKDGVAGKAGEPLRLRDWQKELIRHVFATDGTGYRNRISLIGQPRKNGKSALGAGGVSEVLF